MKIIQVHNYYQQAGGEDGVVTAELELLCNHGHEVVTYYRRNDDIAASGNKLLAIGSLLKASLQTLWNHETYCEFRKVLKSEQPDVVHCHNTFPLISPSIYWACAKEKVPVVQTLHNYRLLCLNAFLFRQTKAVGGPPLAISLASEVTDNFHEKIVTERNGSQQKEKCYEPIANSSPAKGSICELCVKKTFKWPGIKYSCYRDSKAGSLVVALMLFIHKLLGTWPKKVTAYIALTEFQKQKMIKGGLPADKIWVKPNFIQTQDVGMSDVALAKVGEQMTDDGSQQSELNTLKPEVRSLISGQTPFALFVGRLSPEKGCDVLIRAWCKFEEKLIANGSELRAKEMPKLLIVGDGPARSSLEQRSSDLRPPSSVHFLGQQPKESVLSLMRNAQFLVLPSLWYEGFPMTIVEAFSCGLPVVASGDGGMKDVIEERKTGLLFFLGDEGALAENMAWAFSHLDEMHEMGQAARQQFEMKYSQVSNHQELMRIYQSVVLTGK